MPDEQGGVTVPAEADEQLPTDARRARAARLRAEADKLDPPAAAEADAEVPETHVTLRVEEPHASFEYGGTVVGRDPTQVHQLLVPGLMQAAAEAGVTLTQEG